MTPPPAAPSDAPLPVVRVSIRCATIEAFTERWWRLVRGDRALVIPSRPRPAGARLQFSLVISDGSEVLRGEGRVLRSRTTPSGATWVELVFEPLDERSRRLFAVLRALSATHRRALTGEAGESFDEQRPTERSDRPAIISEEFEEQRPTERWRRPPGLAVLRRGATQGRSLLAEVCAPTPLPLPPAPSLPPLAPADLFELDPDDFQVIPATPTPEPRYASIEVVPSLPTPPPFEPVAVARERGRLARAWLVAGLTAGLGLGIALGAVWVRSGAALPPPAPIDRPSDPPPAGPREAPAAAPPVDGGGGDAQ